MLCLWSIWFFGTEVSVLETTGEAHLAVDAASHPVDAPVSGRIVHIDLKVGQEVNKGDVLAELDAVREASYLQEGDARRSGLLAVRKTLKSARRAEAENAVSQRNADLRMIEGARSRLLEAQSSLRLAEAELRRSEQLFEVGLSSDADTQRSREGAEQVRAMVASAESEIVLKEFELDQHSSTHLTQLALYDQQLANLEAEVLQTQAMSKRLSQEVADRMIKAPVSGRIGEVTGLRVGSWVEDGEPVVFLIPNGKMIVVAKFSVTSALGRIKVGQPGTMRLDAFPWIQFGQIGTRVIRTGFETEVQKMRVELEVVEVPDGIVLEHGLSGTVSVTVERISPAGLVLRAAGRNLIGGSH